MQVDLNRAVSNFKLQTKNILIPVYEALTNSIHACATKINITFIVESQLQMDGSDGKIEKIIITDNGQGLTQENIDSFLTLYSSHKVKLGGKGVGRLSFLKVFNEVKFHSIANGRQIDFDFTTNFTNKNISVVPCDNSKPTETTVTLSSCKPDFQSSYTLEKIKENIVEHLAILLFFEREKKIKISLNMNGRVEDITNKDVPPFKTKTFIMHKDNINLGYDTAEFDINYYIEHNSTRGGVDGNFCAHQRQVQTFKDNNFELYLPPKNRAIFFITSNYFDDRVVDARDEFTIKVSETDLFNYLSFNEIKDRLQEEIFQILKIDFPSLEEYNQKQIDEFKYENPELIGFINENPKSFFIKKEAKNKALKELQKEKDHLENLKTKKNANPEEIIQRAEALGALELVCYIKYRRDIINEFSKYDLNKEKEEKKIHDIILKRKLQGGKDYNPVQLKENNLWLLDDKFMTYSYVASDKKIDKLFSEMKNDRPDITIYVNNPDNPKKVILIEFKNFNSDYKNNTVGLAQLTEYAENIRDSGVEEIHCFLITKIDEKFRKKLKSFDYKKNFSQEGEIWQKYFDYLNTLIHVISPQALISDAKARNKTFLDFIIKQQKIKS